MSNVGCDKCWSPDAASAWDSVMSTRIETHLIDEPHFIVSVRCCDSCTQNFLQVTTEMIDWQDGDDPIYRTIIPITATERVRLLQTGPLAERTIAGVGIGRIALRYDWPKGTDPSVYWGTGVRMSAHD